MGKKKIGNLAVILAIVTAIVGATWKVSTLFKDLEVRMNDQKNELEQRITSSENKIILVCHGMKLLSDSLTENKGVNQVLDAIDKISKISEGSFVEFTANAVNVGSISSIQPKELVAFGGALETGEWTFVLGAELPVSSEERLSFLESKLSKTTWYVNVENTVRPKLREVVGVIPSTGTVIMYYAPPPGAGF